MGHHHDIPVPPIMLRAVGTLVVMTLLGVAFVTQTGIGRQAMPPAVPVAEAVTLRFDDQPTGEVAVYDAATNALVETIAVGEGGFVRATLRGLARRTPGTADRTFRIERRANGQVVLIDPRTDTVIDLRAFGPDNQAAFSHYLERAGAPLRTAQETRQ